jgi:hypothetical protein
MSASLLAFSESFPTWRNPNPVIRSEFVAMTAAAARTRQQAG